MNFARRLILFVCAALLTCCIASCSAHNDADNADGATDSQQYVDYEDAYNSDGSLVDKKGYVEGAKDSNPLEKANLALSDLLYQGLRLSDSLSNDVVIVGIDDVSQDDLGTYLEWKRDKVAEAIRTLNRDAEHRPAAIGVDVLYLGETDPEYDELLVESAAEYGNVCVGAFATFNDTYDVSDDGTINIHRYNPERFDEPFEALSDVATVGHINVMPDTDNIIRHHLFEIKYGDRTIPSLAFALANKYRSFYGQPDVARPITDKYGFWYLPFAAKPNSHIEVPISELIDNDDNDANFYVNGIHRGTAPLNDLFDGKVVIIGPYSRGLADDYAMSVDHATKMYGVEYHANAVRAMLDGRYAIEADDNSQIVVTAVILVVAFVLFWKRKVWVSTVAWLAICFGWVGACVIFYNNGLILDVLYVPLYTTILYVGSVAVNYAVTRREKKRINDTFGRYVAPEIVREILKDGDSVALGGTLADIAVLFVDVRGFTTMSEELEPAKVVEILNKYLTLTSECILSRNGTLDKFVGDATMAFWGAPLSQDDYVMNACRAAMDMVRKSGPLSEEILEKYGHKVAFGVGVHTGQAIVGNIGSPKRMDYTAIGDTVNTAARLEANAPGGTVYISRAVADALEGRIIVKSLGGGVALKGKKAGFEVLILEGFTDDEDESV